MTNDNYCIGQWLQGALALMRLMQDVRCEMGGREYVSVVADYLPDGTVRPVSIKLEDGRSFKITQIVSVVHTSKSKFHGHETRFDVKIDGRGHYLYFEDAQTGCAQRWFV